MAPSAARDPWIDRAAIHDLVLRYARAVDRKDAAAVAACFTPDAAYEGALGRGTIVDALAGLRAAFERYQSTLHFVGNVLVDVAGDRATSETYAIAYHRLKAGDGGRLWVVAVRYLDELVRDADGWRIAARRVVREWERDEDVVPLRAPETVLV